MLALLSLLALAQQPAAPPVPTPAQSPIARVEVQPAEAAVQVGDTIRLRAVAFDSAGKRIDAVRVRWFQTGGRFEGSIDSAGLVTGGSTGTLTFSVAVSPAAGGRARAAFSRITVVPQPAARIAIEPAVSRLYAGQSLGITAIPYAANADRRYDDVAWTSDQPAVVAVAAGPRLVAGRPGRATLTARAGRATERMTVTVVPNPVTAVSLEPATASVRTGDVVSFRFTARNAAGRAVTDAIPDWLMSPGHGEIGPDGAFVAAMPGTYRVAASFGGRTAEATVEVKPRDARRPLALVGRLPIRMEAAEFWLHPDGRHGYLTTIGDRIYAIDLSNRGAPVITDSVVVDARAVNDLMTTEDGKFGVLTREGASTRKNGIVILSFEDPAHPKPIAEFTETVTGGVHSTYVYRGYVFVGDEVFSAKPRPTDGGGVVGLGRAFGRLHVIDVSNLAAPREVAWYEPKDGGSHNVWVAGDTLYMGDYQGGLRVLDISGELRGDLLAQGREIAHAVTGDSKGSVPNAPNAWGAIYRDGYIYVPDMNSGLWIVKVDGAPAVTP
jgi:plastocyanin